MKEEKHRDSPADHIRTTRDLEDKFPEKQPKEQRVNIKMKILRCFNLNHSVILGKSIGFSKHIGNAYKGAGY